MRAVRASITIDRDPRAIQEYLLDIGSRAEFAPLIHRELRLTRIDPYGVGAGARFRLHRKLRDRYAGLTITESVPGRLLEEGSTGRGGRVGLASEYLIEEIASGVTKISWTIETYPGNPADRFREFGLRRQIRRYMKSSLRRLRGILEGSPDATPADRPTVNGMSPLHVPNP